MLKKYGSLVFANLLLSLLISCVNTKDLAIATVEPAPVKLPYAVKRIGVVKNIQHADKKEQQSKGVAVLISRDDEFLTQKGINAALDGLLIQLLQDPRFDTIIKLPEADELLQTKDGQVTENSWKAIRSFCERQGLDAIFSLDYYHANTRFTFKKAKINQRDLMRMAVAEKGHQLSLETLIENGWRIYDPFQKVVLDHFVFKDEIKANALGSTPLRAYQNIGSIKDSLVIKSRDWGNAFGSRLLPFETTIHRRYYTKGTDGFELAHNRISAQDWQGAIQLWKKEVVSNKGKLGAMACHNLAVVYEYLQNLEEARTWAAKAYEYKRSKKAWSYIEELDARIVQSQKVQEQLAQLGR